MLDSLAGKAWRGTPADQTGKFLVQSSDLVPGTNPESMRETLTALYSHARRWAPGLDVPFFVPPVRIEALVAQWAGEFRVDEERYVSVSVSAKYVSDADAILLILSHEACHDILRQSELNHRDDVELDEITTDLAMFICGFGDLVLRGHSRVDRSKGRNARVHFGYLSSQQYQEAHAYVLSLRAAQRLPGRIDLAKPIHGGADAPPAVSALLAELLDAADAPPPAKDAEPPAPLQSSAPRLPSQRRAALGPSKRPELPSRAAKNGMSEEFEWRQLDEKMARRHGLPAWIPVPEGQAEGIAEEGLSIGLCREWVNDFLVNSEAGKSVVWRKKNAAMVSSLEAFVDKGPLWDKVQTAFAENDYERAITRLKRIISMDPDDHAARLDLAFALATTGDYPGALKALKAIKKTFEGDPDYHVDLGYVHLALEDKDSALNEMAHVLEAKPDCQAALDAMAQMGILAVAEYLHGRRAEAAAKAEEKARADAAAQAKEKARAIAAAKTQDKARLDALDKIKGAMPPTDTPLRSPDESDPPKVVPGVLNMARLPDLNDRQKQRVLERGRKALAEEGAKARTGGPVQEKTPTGAIDALLALVDLEPKGPARENVLTGAALNEARAEEMARAKAAAKAEKARAEAAVEAENAARIQEQARAEAAAKEKARAEAAAKAEERARAEAAAKAEEKARAIAAAKAQDKARLDALAKIKGAMPPTDTPPRSPDESDPPKIVPGVLNMARLPNLNDRQRQQVLERGRKALAEEGAKARTGGPVQEKTPTGAIDALLALVDLEPKGPARENVLTGTALDEARPNEMARAKAAAKAEKARAEAAAEAENVARIQEQARAEAVAKEKALAEAVDRAEAAATAKENTLDEVAARANEIVRDDAFAKTKDKVARAKEMALHETAAKAKEKARSMRHAILIVAALIIAVALAILGKRMLLY